MKCKYERLKKRRIFQSITASIKFTESISALHYSNEKLKKMDVE